MADTLSDDVLPAPKDGEGKPSGEEGHSADPVSRAEFDQTQRLILDLSKKLDQGLAANRQSAHDTIKAEVSKASKNQKDFLIDRMAALLPANGPSRDALEREARLDALAAASVEPQGQKDELPNSSSSQASGVSLMQAEIGAILVETGLEGDEPELREYVRENKGKRWFEAGPGFYELALKIQARNKGSAAGIVAGQGSRVPASDLEARYLADIAAMRKRREFGLGKFQALKDDYRTRGLENVDSIDISKVR